LATLLPYTTLFRAPDGPAPARRHLHPRHPGGVAWKADREDRRLQVFAREGERPGERRRREEPDEAPLEPAGVGDGGPPRRDRAEADESAEEDTHPERGCPAVRTLGTPGE